MKLILIFFTEDQDFINSNVVIKPESPQPVVSLNQKPLKLAFEATALNKNKFTTFESDFDGHKFNTVKPTKTSLSAAFGDPFGDIKNGNNGNFAFDDDFNDNFSEMKFDDTKPSNKNRNGAFGGFDEADNAKSLTVGAKGKGLAVKQQISKQDFSQDDNFGEVLAAVLERSKFEK